MTPELRDYGTVEWFDEKLGAGYIRRDDGHLVYVHYKDIASGGHRNLIADTAVDFFSKQSAKGIRVYDVKETKDFDPTDFVRTNWAKRLINWFQQRKSVRYMWVVQNGNLCVNMVRYYILKTRFLEVYFHQFIRDDDDVLHDHPWRFWTLILRKSYLEELRDGSTKRLSFPRIIYRPAGYIHRVLVEPIHRGRVWTIVFAGQRKNSWNFYDRQSKKPMTPSQYAEFRGFSLKTNDDFSIKGMFFPKLNLGTQAPEIVLHAEQIEAAEH
ncbi:MAG: cold shock domain-containing protein [Bacteroidota bacterium]